MKSKMLKKIALGGAGFLATAALGSDMIARYTMTGHRQTLEEAKQWQAEHYDISWLDALETHEYTVESFDGYVLHALFLKNPQETDRYLILSHGHTDNRFGSLKYTKMYLDLGFNCILYDLRGHGETEPTFCTYGIREGEDLSELVKDTRNRYGQDIILGLHGESLGAATTAASMMYTPDVQFAVADCGFADITNVLKGILRSRNIHTWVIPYSNATVRLKYGYSYNQMRPINSLKNNQIPICFIHGDADSYVSCENSKRMHEANAGYSELHLIPGAEHAASIFTAPEDYRRYVEAFINKALSKEG